MTLLFDPEPWPQHIGLHLATGWSQPLTAAALRNPYGGIQPLTHASGNYLLGGVIRLGGLAFILSLVRLADDDHQAPWGTRLFQPAKLNFASETGERHINFSWNQDGDHPTVRIDCVFTDVSASSIHDD